jgi:hypothetical protein
MSVTDELLANAERYASTFDKGGLPLPPRQSIRRILADPFIPANDSVRGFVYEEETGKLREVQ